MTVAGHVISLHALGAGVVGLAIVTCNRRFCWVNADCTRFDQKRMDVMSVLDARRLLHVVLQIPLPNPPPPTFAPPPPSFTPLHAIHQLKAAGLS